MILIIILFVLIVLISYFLAKYSMRIFQLKPNLKYEHGLFLIRNPTGLTAGVLTAIFSDLTHLDLMISFERLFKGGEYALVVFGPKLILSKFMTDLNLLEIEDYTALDTKDISIWEVAVRDIRNFKEHQPKLLEYERIWLQVVLKVEDKNLRLVPVQVRVVIYSTDSNRLKELTAELQKSYENILPKIPKPYSKDQLFDFYKTRSFIKDNGKNPTLTSEEVSNLGLFI